MIQNDSNNKFYGSWHFGQIFMTETWRRSISGNGVWVGYPLHSIWMRWWRPFTSGNYMLNIHTFSFSCDFFAHYDLLNPILIIWIMTKIKTKIGLDCVGPSSKWNQYNKQEFSLILQLTFATSPKETYSCDAIGPLRKPFLLAQSLSLQP